MGDRPRKLVVAALVRHRGRVLLSRRREDQAMGGMWELPGGKIEPGEAPEDALTREIAEELGCDISVGRIYDVVFHSYDDFDLLMLVYDAELQGTPEAVEVAEIRWVPLPDVPAMDLLPADYPLARRLAAEAS